MGIILHFLYHGLFDKDIKMIDFRRWPKPPTNEIIKKSQQLCSGDFKNLPFCVFVIVFFKFWFIFLQIILDGYYNVKINMILHLVIVKPNKPFQNIVWYYRIIKFSLLHKFFISKVKHCRPSNHRSVLWQLATL